MCFDHIMKLVLGLNFKENPLFEEKKKEYEKGLLDEYSCLLYVPGDKKSHSF